MTTIVVAWKEFTPFMAREVRARLHESLRDFVSSAFRHGRLQLCLTLLPGSGSTAQQQCVV